MVHVMRGCTIRIWHAGTYTETLFPDGTLCPAMAASPVEQAETAADQARTAQELGYGEDVNAMVREHEILHTLLAEARGQEYSPTLFDVAHGVLNQWYHYPEEKDVLAFQKYMNDPQTADDSLHRLAEEIDLQALLARAREILRPEPSPWA